MIDDIIKVMKIAFFGTPSFAVVSLEVLVKSKHEVVCVVTQPDKPVGRGGRVEFPPVKKVALEHNIPVLQPHRISKELALLEQYKPDIIVTCAFGQMLRQNVLDLCKFGVINVHASLLPKYRGASPIQHCIINGDKVTGVTIMQTDIGMDTGDIILVKEVEIGESETAGELFERLAVVGAEALLEALEEIEQGVAKRVPQNHADATHYPMLNKEDGRIDFSKTAQQIRNQIRGMNPWPIAFFEYKGEVVRVYSASVSNKEEVAEKVVGEVVRADKSGLAVQCGEGILFIEKIQASGGKVLSARDFLNGKRIEVGEIFA